MLILVWWPLSLPRPCICKLLCLWIRMGFRQVMACDDLGPMYVCMYILSPINKTNFPQKKMTISTKCYSSTHYRQDDLSSQQVSTWKTTSRWLSLSLLHQRQGLSLSKNNVVFTYSFSMNFPWNKMTRITQNNSVDSRLDVHHRGMWGNNRWRTICFSMRLGVKH